MLFELCQNIYEKISHKIVDFQSQNCETWRTSRTKFSRSVVDKSCKGAFWRSVGEKCCREVLSRSVVVKFGREVS